MVYKVQGRELGLYILKALRKMHRLDLRDFIAPRIKNKSLFEFIVGVMLSQNTSDENAIKAYHRLLEKYGNPIRPEAILNRSLRDLEDAIRPAGMYRVRAEKILRLAKLFVEEGLEEKLKAILPRLPVDEARRLLTGLPGIGVKTADVILSQYFGKPVFPIDTHIRRITSRLGYIRSRRYEDISRWWMEIVPEEHYVEAHLLLITHGRRVCRARNPNCDKCLLRRICRYGLSHER